MSQYDVVIIGGGPGGYNAAIRAGQLGLKAAIIEMRDTLGGTCLNVGCMPSKALLHASELFESANREFEHLGIEVTPRLNLSKMMAQKDESVTAITKGVEVELHKVGLRMINGNIRDIKDQSGYIDALGKESAARAINDAQIKVAQENQRGSIGRAEAEREQAIRVANAQAEAKRGQNTAQSIIAKSDADLAADQAEAKRRTDAAQKVSEARVLQEGYKAQQEAELARADRDKAAQQADQIVKAEIDKQKVRIDAEARAAQAKIIQEGQSAAYILQKDAEAEGVKRVAEGEAAGIRAKLSAEASGIQAKLTAEAEGTRALLDAKAQGFEKLLRVADDTAGATQLLIAENIVRIAEIQAGAIKGLSFEKVIVMGGGAGGGGASAGPGQFVQDLYKGVLPINELAKSVGLNLPSFLGTTPLEAPKSGESEDKV